MTPLLADLFLAAAGAAAPVFGAWLVDWGMRRIEARSAARDGSDPGPDDPLTRFAHALGLEEDAP